MKSFRFDDEYIISGDVNAYSLFSLTERVCVCVHVQSNSSIVSYKFFDNYRSQMS